MEADWDLVILQFIWHQKRANYFY